MNPSPHNERERKRERERERERGVILSRTFIYLFIYFLPRIGGIKEGNLAIIHSPFRVPVIQFRVPNCPRLRRK